MKKRVFLVLLLLLPTVLFAGVYNDFGFFVGGGMTKVPTETVSLSTGINLGLTQKLEMSCWAITDVVPEPGRNTTLGLEVGCSLLGVRNTGSLVSGINLNAIGYLGAFWQPETEGLGVMVGITPFVEGSPSITKRERLLKTNIGWDFVNRKLLVAVSLLEMDVYLKGTYRDYI